LADNFSLVSYYFLGRFGPRQPPCAPPMAAAFAATVMAATTI
jgi:hypothetical protein